MRKLIPQIITFVRTRRQRRLQPDPPPAPIVAEEEWQQRVRHMDELCERRKAEFIAERQAHAVPLRSEALHE